jgi:hypothetical protein
MDHVVRLMPGQTQAQEFQHDLLDFADDYKLTDDQFKEATRDEQVLSRMWLVRRLIGRYLFHWPLTEVWLDDMVSVGLQTITEFEKLSSTEKLLNALQDRIEQSVNNLRSVVRGSFATNKRRSAANEDLEYVETESLHNVGADDMELQIAQYIDTLDPEDREQYIDNRYQDS